MELTKDPTSPDFRLFSGPVAESEAQLAELLKEYVGIVWDFTAVNGVLQVSVVLLHSRVMARQAMGMGAHARALPPGFKLG